LKEESKVEDAPTLTVVEETAAEPNEGSTEAVMVEVKATAEEAKVEIGNQTKEDGEEVPALVPVTESAKPSDNTGS